MDGLKLVDLALLEFGPTINLSVAPGESICLVGPAGSGKSRLLHTIAGGERPTRGCVTGPKASSIEAIPKRTRVQDLGRRKGHHQPNQQTEVLSSLGLWEVRQHYVDELPLESRTACQLVEEFLGPAELLAWDGIIDALDPWAARGAINLFTREVGRITVATTNNLELVGQFDHLIVLNEYQPVYAGPVKALIDRDGVRAIRIESHFQPGLRALVEPFSASLTRVEGGIRIEPERGQECAVRLMREGYGDLKLLVTEQRTLPEIILDLLR